MFRFPPATPSFAIPALRRLAALALAAVMALPCGCPSRRRASLSELPPPRPRKVRVDEAAARPADPRVFAEYEERLLARVPWPGKGAAEVEQALADLFERAASGVPGVVSCRAKAVDGALVARLELAPRADPKKTADRVAAALESNRPKLPEGVGKAEIVSVRERRPGLAMAE